MLQLQCIKVGFNNAGVGLLYLMQDANGVCYAYPADELVKLIKKGECACTNVRVLPNGDLVTPPTDGRLNYHIPVVPTSPAVQAYNLYMQRCRLMGIEPDAEYIVSGSDVILVKTHIKTGTFVIHEFVTHIGCTVWFAANKAVGVKPIFPEAKDITVINNSNITDMSWLFAGCVAEHIDLRSFDTSKVRVMYGMFSECLATEIFGLENFNTANVVTMGIMFRFCRRLQYLNVCNFNTSNVRDFSGMFYGCDAVSSIDVTHFDTSLVLSMEEMFFYCRGLRSIDLSHFNTARVRNFSRMFEGCDRLEYADISCLDFSSAENIDKLFNSCESLKYLDLSGINEAVLKSAVGFAIRCSSLEVLDLSFITRKFSLPCKTFGTDPIASCHNLKVVYINKCFKDMKYSRQIRWLIIRCRSAHDTVELRFK